MTYLTLNLRLHWYLRSTPLPLHSMELLKTHAAMLRIPKRCLLLSPLHLAK